MADVIDRKAQLRAAWDAAASDEGETTETTEETEEIDAAPEEEPAVEATDDAAPEGETAEEKATRERDDYGRFKPAPEKPAAKAAKAVAAQPAKTAGPTAAAPVKPADVKPAEPVKPDAAHPDLVAPRSWTAGEREAWRKAPADIRKTLYPAIMRAEQETQRVRQEFGSLRRQHGEAQEFKQSVEGFVKPYEGIFRAQGMEPMQGVASVVDTYAALHFGSPQQKAGIIANLLSQFSDVDSVNAILSGQAPAAAAPAYRQPMAPRAPAPAADPRAIVREELAAFREQAVAAKADRDWSAFEQGAPEFLDVLGVQENMQTILDAANARGRNPTYQQAYDLALKMDPEIQAILEQRAQSAAVTAQQSATAPTARARVAAATVRSRPAGVQGEESDLTDRRAVIARMAGRRA